MQENNYPIKHWAKDDQPREKLLACGAENLSNSELLAILVNNGTRTQSAVDLAREILKLGHNNLVELGKLTVQDLMKVEGIGEAKAITIAAALELGRRREGVQQPAEAFALCAAWSVVSVLVQAARYLQAIGHARREPVRAWLG